MNDDVLLTDMARKKLADPIYLKQVLAKGVCPKDIVEFSEETMARFYGTANQFFQEECFTDASDAFLFLCYLDPSKYEYWLGLGMATQMNHNYEGAIDAYELAAICDINSPVPYFYLAKCLFAIHDHESSLQALELAIESAGEDEQFAELKEQAVKAKDVLLRSD